MKFISVNGVTLNCDFAGVDDGPPLIFINSLGSDLRIWDGVISHFAHRYLLIRYDKRGHGLSDSPPGPYTIRDHANDLAGLFEQSNLEDGILVGASVGGMIALDFSAAYPQRVQALVLCDTAAKLGTAAYWNERIETIRQHGMAQAAEPILARWFAPTFASVQPAAYQGYKNMLTRTDVKGYQATCAAIGEADLRPVVGAVRAPALVLCGAEDSATPPDLVRTLAEALPNGRFQLIADAGHTPSVEQPEALARAIGAFLEEL